jgi:predicted O-methyltransferase YrrM
MRTEPPAVTRARQLADRLAFGASCSDGTGWLLATLAAAVHGTVAESGTGCGFGTAWLRSGLREGSRLVTVERDGTRAAAVTEAFAGDPAVTVVTGDWTAITGYHPFVLLFLDGGGKSDGPDAVADLMAPGGLVVMDDFTPSVSWPPMFQGEPDALRVTWLTDPRFTATDLPISPTESLLLATRH